jgi:flotillin
LASWDNLNPRVPLYIVLSAAGFSAMASVILILNKYRLSFVLDVKAFFRLSDSNIEAQRVSAFDPLRSPLLAILHGVVRTILASADIEKIMYGRRQFGEAFTKEAESQLKN